jgi:predicted nucleic acid-binding Zn ribbon protein
MGLFSRKEEDPAVLEQKKNEYYANIDKQTEIWRSGVAKGYQEHAHCSVCGRAIHFDKKYCSIECKGKYEGMQKKQKKSNNMMCWITALILPIMLIFTLVIK